MRRYLPSNYLSAAVRAHFGLTQTELGRYLGVQREQVAFVEAGQRTFSVGAERRLRPLGLLLPESRAGGPPAPLAAEPVAPPDAPDVAALRKRLRRATNRQAILNDKQDLRGPAARLTRELDLAQVQAQITETNAYKTAVTARLTAL